jgi:hypothetical protein
MMMMIMIIEDLVMMEDENRSARLGLVRLGSARRGPARLGSTRLRRKISRIISFFCFVVLSLLWWGCPFYSSTNKQKKLSLSSNKQERISLLLWCFLCCGGDVPFALCLLLLSVVVVLSLLWWGCPFCSLSVASLCCCGAFSVVVGMF